MRKFCTSISQTCQYQVDIWGHFCSRLRDYFSVCFATLRMIYDFCSELITNGPKCNFLREEELLPLDVASLANQHFLYFFLARCNFWRALFPLFPSPSFFIPHDDSWLGADSFQNFSVMCILKSEELEYVSEKPKLTNWVTSEAIRGQNHFFILQDPKLCFKLFRLKWALISWGALNRQSTLPVMFNPRFWRVSMCRL